LPVYGNEIQVMCQMLRHYKALKGTRTCPSGEKGWASCRATGKQIERVPNAINLLFLLPAQGPCQAILVNRELSQDSRSGMQGAGCRVCQDMCATVGQSGLVCPTLTRQDNKSVKCDKRAE